MTEQGEKRKPEAKPDSAGDKAAKKAKFFSTVSTSCWFDSFEFDV
jgi:hypothetical protein